MRVRASEFKYGKVFGRGDAKELNERLESFVRSANEEVTRRVNEKLPIDVRVIRRKVYGLGDDDGENEATVEFLEWIKEQVDEMRAAEGTVKHYRTLVDRLRQFGKMKEWTRFEFTLPADAKYFAINCVSSNTYALLVDEVSYESVNADLLEFRGYNVYLDGVRINDQIVEDNEFVDRNPQIEGEHIYNVTAIFDKGESCLSNDYSFNLSGVNTLAADGMAVKAGRNCIIVTNAGGKEVTISAVNGMVMFRQDVGDYARISLDPGIYMLRAGDRIVKIVVR